MPKKTPLQRKPGDYLPSRIGGVLSRSFTLLGLGGKISEFKIKKAWPAIVGPAISKRARPGRLTGKTLHVAVSSSAWMNELCFHKEEIIGKINSEIGEGVIEEIIFKPGKLAEPPERKPAKERKPLSEEERLSIEETVSGIKDPELKGIIKRAMEKGKSQSDGKKQ